MPEIVQGELLNAEKQESKPPFEVIDKRHSAAETITQAENQLMIPNRMIEIALQNNAGIEVLERLFAMKKEADAAIARAAFYEAFAAFKADPPILTKNKHVHFKSRDSSKPDTDYWHATLDQVAIKLSQSLAKHDLSFRWVTKQEGGIITVTCILSHKLGHTESATLYGPLDSTGNKNVIQQGSSTVSYLERYTLLAVTGMAAKGQDDDGRTGVAAEESGDQAGGVFPELAERLEWIANAGPQEVDKIFQKAYQDAGKAGDRNGQDRLIEAKNERKRELRAR